MSLVIAGGVLPDPQSYTVSRLTTGEVYVGFDGTAFYDYRAGNADYLYNIRIRWEGLTEVQKNAVLFAWFAINTNGQTFVGVDGMTGYAYRKSPDFRFIKDGKVQGDGTLLWDTYLDIIVLEYPVP